VKTLFNRNANSTSSPAASSSPGAQVRLWTLKIKNKNIKYIILIWKVCGDRPINTQRPTVHISQLQLDRRQTAHPCCHFKLFIDLDLLNPKSVPHQYGSGSSCVSVIINFDEPGFGRFESSSAAYILGLVMGVDPRKYIGEVRVCFDRLKCHILSSKTVAG